MIQRVPRIPAILCLAALYVVAARVGLAVDAVAGFATLVWPPTGIALAAILLLGRRVWPGIFLGAAIANILTGAPIAVALGIATGNTLEAVVGGYLIRRVPHFMPTLENVTSVVALIVRAVLLSTLISASIGVASLYVGGIFESNQLFDAWRAWWIGDMVGALLVAPAILVWSTRPHIVPRHNPAEYLGLWFAVIAVGVTTFFDGVFGLPPLHTPFHQMDVLFAVLVWAGLRFGQRTAVTVALAISVTAVVGTMGGHGPFALPDLGQSLLSLQTFTALFAATVLLLTATVSERRMVLEEVRQARDEAMRANRVKSEFVAVVSHELRTPLNAISGYSELLQSGAYGALSAKQTDIVSRIRQSEERLLTLVEEVLGFANVERGEVAVKTRKVEVGDALDAVEKKVGPGLRRKHFTVNRNPNAGHLAVMADRDSLQQILLSLVSNASKYTEDGGSITLAAESQGNNVSISVTDSGRGIAADQIENVFKPFFQTDGGTKRRASGVGLGLTIARDLARRMNGDITLASKVGSGTTASVVLPAA
jgi:signal transduction histidine kinase